MTVSYSICINVSYNATSLLGMTCTFLWCPFIPNPESTLSTALTTTTRTTNTYNEYDNSTALTQVVVNTLKFSDFFVCSLSVNSWISLIFTLARFISSTEDKLSVSGFCKGISLIVLFHIQLNNNLCSLEIMAIHLLVYYFVQYWIKQTTYYVWNTFTSWW